MVLGPWIKPQSEAWKSPGGGQNVAQPSCTLFIYTTSASWQEVCQHEFKRRQGWERKAPHPGHWLSSNTSGGNDLSGEGGEVIPPHLTRYWAHVGSLPVRQRWQWQPVRQHMLNIRKQSPSHHPTHDQIMAGWQENPHLTALQLIAWCCEPLVIHAFCRRLAAGGRATKQGSSVARASQYP